MSENPPAFPVGDNDQRHGMSLRDWFAGQAVIGMAGYLTNTEPEEVAEEAAKIAKAAHALADAMFAERERQHD